MSIRLIENDVRKSRETHVQGSVIEEEPWSDDIENLVLKWKKHATKLSNLHQRAGYSIKFKHNVFGFPPIILPLTMTFVSQIINNSESETIVNGLMFLVSGIFGAFYKWLNLGEQYALHFQYSARYDDIITAIDTELSRQKRFRRAADAFVTEIKAKIDNLNQTSPEFPACCCANMIMDDVSDDNDNNHEDVTIKVNGQVFQNVENHHHGHRS